MFSNKSNITYANGYGYSCFTYLLLVLLSLTLLYHVFNWANKNELSFVWCLNVLSWDVYSIPKKSYLYIFRYSFSVTNIHSNLLMPLWSLTFSSNITHINKVHSLLNTSLLWCIDPSSSIKENYSNDKHHGKKSAHAMKKVTSRFIHWIFECSSFSLYRLIKNKGSFLITKYILIFLDYKNFLNKYIYIFPLGGIPALDELQFDTREWRHLSEQLLNSLQGATYTSAKVVPIWLKNNTISSPILFIFFLNTNSNSLVQFTESIEKFKWV
ncbi:hypothetical protein H8356DRAFT_1355662 [Neocallimastix lanati (nom. inval.)]|nr:hypothetical protein H8356DRAFT_1355662 [Neocallimastix sp. JGI-2020a]